MCDTQSSCQIPTLQPSKVFVRMTCGYLKQRKWGGGRVTGNGLYISMLVQETFDEAVEALVELIYSTSSRGAPDQDSMALVVRLVPAVPPNPPPHPVLSSASPFPNSVEGT